MKNEEDNDIIKKFYIEGDGTVTDVGLRPSLVVTGSEHNVVVFARNIKKNKVEIIVSGCEEDIKEFWNAIKHKDLRILEKTDGYKTTNLEKYDGCPPHWEYSSMALNLEQATKGIIYLKSIDNKLDVLPKKIAEAIKNTK